MKVGNEKKNFTWGLANLEGGIGPRRPVTSSVAPPLFYCTVSCVGEVT